MVYTANLLDLQGFSRNSQKSESSFLKRAWHWLEIGFRSQQWLSMKCQKWSLCRLPPAERASRLLFLFADSVYRVPKLPSEAKIKYSISKCNRVLEFDDF